MASQSWHFATPTKPEKFNPTNCDGCKDWAIEARAVREANAALDRWRKRPAIETRGHEHG